MGGMGDVQAALRARMEVTEVIEGMGAMMEAVVVVEDVGDCSDVGSVITSHLLLYAAESVNYYTSSSLMVRGLI